MFCDLCLTLYSNLRNKPDLICADGISKSILIAFNSFPIIVIGKDPFVVIIFAFIFPNGSEILFIGLLDKELSPVKTVLNF